MIASRRRVHLSFWWYAQGREILWWKKSIIHYVEAFKFLNFMSIWWKLLLLSRREDIFIFSQQSYFLVILISIITVSKWNFFFAKLWIKLAFYISILRIYRSCLRSLKSIPKRCRICSCCVIFLIKLFRSCMSRIYFSRNHDILVNWFLNHLLFFLLLLQYHLIAIYTSSITCIFLN